LNEATIVGIVVGRFKQFVETLVGRRAISNAL
jgi:hypothetical protein